MLVRGAFEVSPCTLRFWHFISHRSSRSLNDGGREDKDWRTTWTMETANRDTHFKPLLDDLLFSLFQLHTFYRLPLTFLSSLNLIYITSGILYPIILSIVTTGLIVRTCWFSINEGVSSARKTALLKLLFSKTIINRLWGSSALLVVCLLKEQMRIWCREWIQKNTQKN